MSKIPTLKTWKDPQPDLKQVYKHVINKSKAGVEHVHYVPTWEGKAPTGANRINRRKTAAYERSVEYRTAIAKRERKAEKIHQKIVSASKERKLSGK